MRDVGYWYLVIVLGALIALSCESERSPPLSRNVADSLDRAAEVLYDQGRYRAALKLYQEGHAALPEIETADDSLLASSLLIGIAYCKYYLDDLEDEDETWLEAWRLAQASPSKSLVVRMTQRAASLHSRRKQYSLEIRALATADSLAASDSSVSDSLRSVVREQLKGALYDCFRSERCEIPDSVEVDSTSVPPMVFVLGGLAVIALLVLLGTSKQTE